MRTPYYPDGSFHVGFKADTRGCVSPVVADSLTSAAYDILHDDGMAPDKIADLLIGCRRSGRDPEAFARHLVELRRAVDLGEPT